MITPAQKAKEDDIELMGSELGEVYHKLWQELAHVHTRWYEYDALYGNEDQIELLNKTASSFFAIVQSMFWETVIMHIARMTDSPRTTGKDNLTIQRLPEVVSDKALASEIQDLVDKAKESAAFCRDWRHRRFAHRDLDISLKRHCNPLETANKEKVEAALARIANVLNHIQKYYKKSTTMYSFGVGAIGGSRSLLHAIKK